MFFFPAGFLILILFILFLPILFLLGFFQIVTIGFENLGIPASATILILISMLVGSFINIPLTKKRLIYVEESRFLDYLKSVK